MKPCQRILIVEDNDLVGCMMSDILSAFGHDPVGPVGDEVAAISALDDGSVIDLAVLDVHFNGSSENVAKRLEDRGIPYVWATGNEFDVPPFSHAPVCLKPFTGKQLIGALDLAFAA